MWSCERGDREEPGEVLDLRVKVWDQAQVEKKAALARRIRGRTPGKPGGQNEVGNCMTAGVTLPSERSTATPRMGAGDHALQAGPMRASVRAQAGGRIASLWREERDGSRTDVLVPMQDLPFNPDQWQKAGCYPLAPWSNRIRDASFPFGGETVRLPAHPSCPPHTVHGFSHARAWIVTAHDGASLEMCYRHSPDAWPWAFEAVQLVTLDETGLTIAMSVQNLSDRAMPAGFGVHPFFKADHGDVVRFTCDTAWRSDAAGCGTHAEALAPAQASHEVRIGPSPVTDYFAGFHGVASIARQDGTRIVVEAGAPLDHFVFHVPPGGAYACLEPVSHVADAFNLAARGVEGSGMISLEPDETISAIVRIALA